MRFLLRTAAIAALLPYVGVLFLLATGNASWSSVAYVLAIGALLGGLITLPDPQAARDEEGRVRKRRPRGLSRGAVVVLALIAIVRLFTASDGRSLRAVDGASADAPGSARLVNRLVDEGDVALAGTRFLVATGLLHDDRPELPSAMGNAYLAMKHDEGDAPSPFVATYLGLERPAAFDLVIIEPTLIAEATAHPRSALIFLHGFGGNFDLPCWQIAKAVASLDVVTACPSTRWVGDWWSLEGEATLRRTIDVLHARGVDRIVLAGLSNGGFGASRLAPRLHGDLAGLILISGAERTAPRPGIPTLVIHGRRDTMTSFAESEAYATKVGAKLVAVDAGHFAMLVRGPEVDRAIRDFVASRVEARAER
jgi:pimeloyl-ACP methyl ester carboxylesterase